MHDLEKMRTDYTKFLRNLLGRESTLHITSLHSLTQPHFCQFLDLNTPIRLKCFLFLLFIAIFYRRWSKDPFTRGAYSEPVVGMTPQDFSNLAENLGRLYFAGEATSEDWYGYMQGAYLTGKKQGQKIADDFLQKKLERNEL